MAGLASATERIQIGSLVACTGFRNPGLVAKMTETIDDISGVGSSSVSARGGTSRSTTRSAIPSITGSAASRRRWRSSNRCCVANTSTSRASSSRPATPSTDRADRAHRRAHPGRLHWPPHAAHHRPLRRCLEHGLAWGPRCDRAPDGRSRRGLPRRRPGSRRHWSAPRAATSPCRDTSVSVPIRSVALTRRSRRRSCASGSSASSTSWPGSIPARRKPLRSSHGSSELVDAA